jgi:hypothetical protein
MAQSAHKTYSRWGPLSGVKRTIVGMENAGVVWPLGLIKSSGPANGPLLFSLSVADILMPRLSPTLGWYP